MRIVLLGAPGSGKGTQAQRLTSLRRVPQVSSGDLLRDAVARGTELGLQAKAAMDAGELVSDDLVLALIRERLSRPDALHGFILDGFPRNSSQAVALDDMLGKLGQPLDAVVLMNVDPAILMKRLTGRRNCARCGRVFNIYTSPPGADTPCVDGQEHDLRQRADDKEETIRNRLDVYAAQTQPLIEHYRSHGLLRDVNAAGDVDEVAARLEKAVLGAIAPAKRAVRRASVRRAGPMRMESATAAGVTRVAGTGRRKAARGTARARPAKRNKVSARRAVRAKKATGRAKVARARSRATTARVRNLRQPRRARPRRPKPRK
jgi:adenylate kinase